MKKGLACVTVLCVLFCAMAIGVVAEETTTTTETTTTESTGETTTTTSTEPSETTGDETTTTTIGETTTTLDDSTTTTTVPTEPQELTVELDVAAQENGRFSITATDETGRPVAGYPLLIQVGLTTSHVETNANGVYNSFGWVPGKTLTYSGKGLTVGLITYLPVAQTAVEHPNTVPTSTTATTETTTTVTESATTTTTTTVPTGAGTTSTTAIPVVGSTAADVIMGNRTTATSGSNVIIGAATDSTVLGLFGYEQAAFLRMASLQLSAKDYTTLIGAYGNYSVMLNVTVATALPSETMLNAALKGSETFGHYSTNERKAISFRLSLLVLDSAGEVVPMESLPDGVSCLVKLPVPKSMENADELAITIPGGKGLQTPVSVEPKDGYILLDVNALPENYTLIEFTEDEDGSSLVSLLLYIFGAVFLVGAGLLLFFFVFRKPKAAKSEEEPTDKPELITEFEADGDDFFSGRTDLPAYEEPAPEAVEEEPTILPPEEE